MSDKAIIAEKAEKLMEMTAGFCQKHLNEEYLELSRKLIQKMARKRNVPFLYGKPETWAAAVIYALGQINFLFDKSTQPYSTPAEICGYLGTTQSTASRKAKLIRDMFKMGYFNEEFSLSEIIEDSPLKNLVMVNGFIVDQCSLF